MYKISIKKENSLQASIIIAGFTALTVQVVFLRNFLIILNGNELVIGIILSNWMLLTGFGAYLGQVHVFKKSSINHIIVTQLFTGLLPPISFLALYFAKAYFFAPGVLPGFYDSWVLSLLIMAPFCILSGALFTFLVGAYSQLHFNSRAAQVYALEALGSVAGSIIFTFLLIRFFDLPEILIVVSSANFATAILVSIAWEKKPGIKHTLFIGLLMWVLLHWVFDWFAFARASNYKGQIIIENRDTPYGNLTITRSGDQLNLFENGMAVYSSANDAANEECVHFAMAQHLFPKNVLIISGNISGLYHEIEKYQIEHVDYVGVNKDIIEITGNYFGIPHNDHLNIHHLDPRLFIKKSNDFYDVILMNLPPPASLQFNRFYTKEFFEMIKTRLSPGGILSFQVEGNSNYVGDEMMDLYAIQIRTLKSVFNNVLIIPGASNYLLASDSVLSYRIALAVETRGIKNQFVNKYYLDDELIEMRGNEILYHLDQDAKVNLDFYPVAYFKRISYWLSWYNIGIQWVIIGVSMVLLLFMVLFRLSGKAMFTAGFTASSVSVMVLLIFQILFGYLFQSLALFIAAFMGGLAFGVWLSVKIVKRVSITQFLVNQLLVGMSVLLVPVFIGFYKTGISFDLFNQFFLFAIILFSGIVTGVQFSWSSDLSQGSFESKAAKIYGADLIGSAIGALFTVIVLLPAFGILYTCVIIFMINVLMIGWIRVSGKRYL